MFKRYRDVAKEGWGREFCGDKSQNPSDSELLVGHAERIADALERLASGKAQLDTLQELSDAKLDLGIVRRERDHARRLVSYWKGRVTRLKRKGA